MKALPSILIIVIILSLAIYILAEKKSVDQGPTIQENATENTIDDTDDNLDEAFTEIDQL